MKKRSDIGMDNPILVVNRLLGQKNITTYRSSEDGIIFFVVTSLSSLMSETSLQIQTKRTNCDMKTQEDGPMKRQHTEKDD